MPFEQQKPIKPSPISAGNTFNKSCSLFMYGELNPQSRNDFEPLGNPEFSLLRSEPFKLARSVVLPADDTVSVAFVVRESNLLTGIGDEDEIKLHFRSKWAHLGLDSRKNGREILDRAMRSLQEGKNRIEIPIINHSQRSIVMFDSVFHLYSYPDQAVVRGESLEKMVGNRPGAPVYIHGEEGRDYRVSYETSPFGENRASAVYLRIDPERFWLPPSSVALELPREGNFTKMREILFQYAFKRTVDPENPMPRNGLWIGKAPFLTVHPNLYLELDHYAFGEVNGEFIKVGMQTHSPLLEGGRTNHHPHVEMKGKAEWAKVRVIRNAVLAQAG